LLEKELKYELSKADYLKLVRALRPKRREKLKLVNYYFDDSELRLRKKRYALRIRIINNRKVLFTLKYPAKTPRSSPTALKIRIEHEVEIPLKDARQLLGQNMKILEIDAEPIRILRRKFTKEILTKVKPLGLVETDRTVVPMPKKLELEIDSCRMFNKKFYELEIETNAPKRADRQVRELLADHGIPYQPLTRSKFGRFIEEWKRRNR
jgi:uncharacterized protein YjbK